MLCDRTVQRKGVNAHGSQRPLGSLCTIYLVYVLWMICFALLDLLEFWRSTAKRVYTLYEESAVSYFSYLNLTSTNQVS